MEKKLDTTIRKKKEEEYDFLPHSFKKIGFVIISLVLALAVYVVAFGLDVSPGTKDWIKTISLSLFIFGLLLVARAKDKFEDEMTLLLKLKALRFAFVWAVLYVILKPVIDLLLVDAIIDLSAQEVVIAMLSMYIVYYWIQKKYS